MSDDRELSALYHSADKPQPPTALDETIRSAAHQAIKPKHSHAPQWLGGIAASLIAVLLITQLLPTMEQEANIAPGLDNAPRLDMYEEALVPAAPPSVKKKAEAERARISKQQAPERGLAQDEADAALSSEPMAEEIRVLIAPQTTSTSPEMELKIITDLLDAEKIHEAKQRLDDFRKRYPDATIPDTITQRISK